MESGSERQKQPHFYKGVKKEEGEEEARTARRMGTKQCSLLSNKGIK